jgi:hypothetical protein
MKDRILHQKPSIIGKMPLKARMITLKSMLRVSENVLFRSLEGEVVLQNISSGQYYGLDSISARMWTLLSEHERVEEAYLALLDEYKVDATRLRTDFLKMVNMLVKNGLMEVVDDS